MMEQLEQWRDVVGYEGLYQVSALGLIKSLDRIITHKLGGSQKIKGRILRPIGMSRYSPHFRVTLCKGGIKTVTLIHRIVAEAWIGPCPDGFEICHGKGGQTDNSVSNLRYDTHRNNLFDAVADGKIKTHRVKRSDGM